MIDYFLEEGILAPSDASVALIVVGGDHYLMQLRDQKPGIFYPGHWGLFGGASDAGEDAIATLRRELDEELGLAFSAAKYFTEFVFDFACNGAGNVRRTYFELDLSADTLDGLSLNEGTDLSLFSAHDALSRERVTPYDAFAIWMHATQKSK